MPDSHCVDELHRWSEQARTQGFADSATLLRRAAVGIDDRKPDDALAAELLAYRAVVVGRGGMQSFAELLAKTASTLKSQ